MKKLLLLITTLILTVGANAQVLFADPATGKTYADGETMRLLVTVDPEWDEVMCPAPALVNNGATAVNVRMDVNIKQLPEGTTLADCFSGKCTNYGTTGTHSTTTKSLAAGAKMSTEIEWNSLSSTTWENVYGTAIVEFTLYVNNEKSSTVTVEFINADPASVGNVEASATTRVWYTMGGQRVMPGTKGLLVSKGKKVLKR